MEKTKNESSSSLDSMAIDPELTPEEIERQKILKQKRINRRYLRLKRNNYVKRNKEQLVDKFYVDNFLPKLEQILQENQ